MTAPQRLERVKQVSRRMMIVISKGQIKGFCITGTWLCRMWRLNTTEVWLTGHNGPWNEAAADGWSVYVEFLKKKSESINANNFSLSICIYLKKKKGNYFAGQSSSCVLFCFVVFLFSTKYKPTGQNVIFSISFVFCFQGEPFSYKEKSFVSWNDNLSLSHPVSTRHTQLTCAASAHIEIIKMLNTKLFLR